MTLLQYCACITTVIVNGGLSLATYIHSKTKTFRFQHTKGWNWIDDFKKNIWFLIVNNFPVILLETHDTMIQIIMGTNEIGLFN